ncbi:MAG: DUF6612 family protein [Lachnospiraceae bacterium]|uniref:DUF6612 family protein n=1 Tax=Parablautia sp. Marseille-Q6255 TaxID=3039593 RepID=UPI0024BCEEBA|nr:DUF6612 family protein [Parablautia sp. Marseille-Q6255]
MKKQLFAGLVTLGAVSMLCGFDSAQTADTISSQMSEAVAAANSASAAITANLDAGVDISDGATTSTLGLNASGNLSYDAVLDPLSMKMEGSYEFSMLGEGQSQSMQLYLVPDETGAYKSYSYLEDAATGEGTWYLQEGMAVEAQELTDLVKSASENMGGFTDLGIELTLAPEAADVDGTECYLLTATIDSASISSLLEKTSAITGEDLTADEDIALALSVLDGIALNVEYYVDTTTFLPVKMHMDLNSSDFSTIEALLTSATGMAAAEGAPESTVGLTVNDASLDIVMSYDTVSEITVPEEAVASAQSIDLAAEAEMTAELAESEAADLAAEVAETEAVTEAVTE